MNDWHWSDFHFNFEQYFLCASENLSNIHCGPIVSACHKMKEFCVKYKSNANFDKVKFPSNISILGHIWAKSGRRAACARCHARLGLSGDQNHIGTGMWWERAGKNWSLYGPPTVPINAMENLIRKFSTIWAKQGFVLSQIWKAQQIFSLLSTSLLNTICPDHFVNVIWCAGASNEFPVSYSGFLLEVVIAESHTGSFWTKKPISKKLNMLWCRP